MAPSACVSAFSLLKLPTEIRLYIYRELLIQPSSFEPMLCSCYSERHQYWKDRGSIHPAILRTCKLAYAEAYPTLYRESTFQLSCKYHGHDMHEEGLPDGHFITPHTSSAPLLRAAVIDLDLEIMSTDGIYSSIVGRVGGTYPNIRKLVLRMTKHGIEPEYLEVTLRWVQLEIRSFVKYNSALTDILHRRISLMETGLDHVDEPQSPVSRVTRVLTKTSEFWKSATNSLCAVTKNYPKSDDMVFYAVLPVSEWSREKGMIWSIGETGDVEDHPTFLGL